MAYGKGKNHKDAAEPKHTAAAGTKSNGGTYTTRKGTIKTNTSSKPMG